MPLMNGGSPHKLDAWRSANLLAAAVLVVMGMVYVGKTWSPSSYGYVLVNHLGYADSGPAWGTVRPVRSDEWGVVTPLTQATINNGFERINRTSLYGEDLRINYGLPIRDWGLIFKPTLWLYGWTNPAYAYSLHWFALSALFIFGYAWLFRWLGATPVVGFALAAGLYFTGFVQFWWNEKGPIFALFPWVILPFATRIPLVWKAALFYWIAVVWLLTNFYPTIQVSLAFVGLVLLLAREPKLFRPLPMAGLAFAAALAAGTAALYLWDYLQATATTLYPGGRNFPGGAVPFRWGLSWLLPAVNFDRFYNSLLPDNICEIGTVGLYYSLLVVCFLDFARWRQVWSDTEQRRVVTVLGMGLLMMLAWMALPLPAWVGAPLLWNHIHHGRMQYAGGLLLICLLIVLVHSLGLHVSRVRLAIFCAAIVLGFWAWKYDPGKSHFEDLLILIFAVVAFAVAKYRPGAAHASFAIASLLAGILLFGRFNPLQSAWPIFNHPPNEITKAFDQLAASNGGVLAVTGLPGAVGNGLGYRSLSHVTAVPKLEFWRNQFPDMSTTEFETIFNRYSHIVPVEENAPRRMIEADAVAVPVGLFQKHAPVRYVPSPTQQLDVDGHIDRAVLEAGGLVLLGWGPWTGPLEAHELEISIAPPTSGAPTRALAIRLDLPPGTQQRISALNGFSLTIPLSAGAIPHALCLVAHDPTTGKRTLLHNPPEFPYCQISIESHK